MKSVLFFLRMRSSGSSNRAREVIFIWQIWIGVTLIGYHLTLRAIVFDILEFRRSGSAKNRVEIDLEKLRSFGLRKFSALQRGESLARIRVQTREGWSLAHSLHIKGGGREDKVLSVISAVTATSGRARRKVSQEATRFRAVVRDLEFFSARWLVEANRWSHILKTVRARRKASPTTYHFFCPFYQMVDKLAPQNEKWHMFSAHAQFWLVDFGKRCDIPLANIIRGDCHSVVLDATSSIFRVIWVLAGIACDRIS